MELTLGKKDHPSAPPSRLVLESNEQIRVVKCMKDSNQAMEIYSSIEQVRSTYGPRQLQMMLLSLSSLLLSGIIPDFLTEFFTWFLPVDVGLAKLELILLLLLHCFVPFFFSLHFLWLILDLNFRPLCKGK
ncbi:OLC1v1020582C1 [Oldenlandia corymbosa var. corymbosa]|uniref:OLC1v1020582C1 n=1 Tax=Oldenlandia corymbosa var. corymbosa TaxID=529605 RepID=A0AAV1EGV7_OLDCO|nr:OLC1v1020582C1 [Oldenlandia corymbosa var. corymbosa]